MIFEKILLPDDIQDNFECVTPEYLKQLGKKFIFCDIDNTLATYDDPTPPTNVVCWCREMNENGISISFVSNNDHARVELFNRELGYVWRAKAGKPFTNKLKEAMAELGASAENSVFLGDQLLTDAACANLAGLYSIIVPPIKDKTSVFFRFKRWLEKPYMRRYRLLKGGEKNG